MRGLAVTASAIVLAGCGAHAGIQAAKLPLACAAGPGPLLKALRSAPAAVGFPFATAWQGALDVSRTWNGVTLLVDESVADRKSPSAP